VKRRKKLAAPKPDLGQLELPVESSPRRILDLESLARLYRSVPFARQCPGRRL
jgi:hypothetical protein